MKEWYAIFMIIFLVSLQIDIVQERRNRCGARSGSRSLGLNLAVNGPMERFEEDEVKEAVVSNEEIEVEFVMPEGSRFTGWFRMGQTVEVLKAEVAARYSVAMTSVVGTCNIFINPA